MAFVYNNAAKLIQDNSPRINPLSDTLKIILVDDTYVADRDDVFVSAAASAELAGTGYTGGFAGSGRKTLGTKALTVDNANNRATFGAANVTWTGIDAGTAHAAIIIKEVTDDDASLLIAYLDGTSDFVTNGGDMVLTLPSGLAWAATT